jgi:thymidylate synthase
MDNAQQGSQSHFLVATNADDAYTQTLSKLLEHGRKVSAGESESIGSERDFHEILNFSVRIERPSAKLVFNEARRINLPAAVARFVWMMAGSERLKDIKFYEPKVESFSDDGIIVPGSSYGHRMLNPRPGLNQLEAVIDRIKNDVHTRRAAVSIYQPGDASRASSDIPCAFGLFYNVRDGGLHATTLMRSNNAFILLPYNVFEFTLVAEIVAKEVGVSLDSMTHSAISMHLFDSAVEGAKDVIEQRPKREALPSLPTPPSNPSPLEQVRTIVRMEADLRHESSGLNLADVQEHISKAQSELDGYWRQFYYLLMLPAATEKSRVLQSNRTEASAAIKSIRSVLQDPWLSYLREERISVPAVPNETQGDGAGQTGDLFGSQSGSSLPFSRKRARDQLREVANEYESRTEDTITWQEFAAVEDEFGKELAARGDDEVSLEEFEELLDTVRQ